MATYFPVRVSSESNLLSQLPTHQTNTDYRETTKGTALQPKQRRYRLFIAAVLVFLVCIVLYSASPYMETGIESMNSLREYASQHYPLQCAAITHAAVGLLAIICCVTLLRIAFNSKVFAPPGTILGDWVTMLWFEWMMWICEIANPRARRFFSESLRVSILGGDGWWSRFDDLDISDQAVVEQRANKVLNELKCSFNYSGLSSFDPAGVRAVIHILQPSLQQAVAEPSDEGLLQREYEQLEVEVIKAHTEEQGEFAFNKINSQGSRAESLRRELRTIVVTGLLGYHSTRLDMREWYRQEWQHSEMLRTHSHACGPHGTSIYTERNANNGGIFCGEATDRFSLRQLLILQHFFRSERGSSGYGGNAEEYDAWLAELILVKHGSQRQLRDSSKDLAAGRVVGRSKANMHVRSWGAWVKLMDQVRLECEQK
jgi:hypothetical protein